MCPAYVVTLLKAESFFPEVTDVKDQQSPGQVMADEFELFDEFVDGPGGSDGAGIPEDQAVEPSSVEEDVRGGEPEEHLEEFNSGEMERLTARLAPLLEKLACAAGRAVSGECGCAKCSGAGAEDGETETQEDLESSSEILAGLNEEDDALAHELAGEAAETDDEFEAESLAGGLVVQIFTPAPVVIKRVVPVLIQRTARLVRLFRRAPRFRRLVRVLPSIAASTLQGLTRAANQGRPVTRRTAIRTLGSHTVRVLRSPRRVMSALRRNRVRRSWFNRRAIARAERSF